MDLAILKSLKKKKRGIKATSLIGVAEVWCKSNI